MGKNFTCFSGCVTRDVFRFLDKVEFPSPKTFGFGNISCAYKVPFAIALDDIKIGTEYEKKCMFKDINKKTFMEIERTNTEWFIFDIINERLPIVEFCNEKGERGYATKGTAFVGNWESLKQKYELTELHSYFTQELFDDLEYEKNITSFCNMIIEKWGEDKIIFNEVVLAEKYLDEDKCIMEFNVNNGKVPLYSHNQTKLVADFLNKVSCVIKKNIPNMHIIQIPINNYADASHWFNLHPLHFSNSYYEYVANCIKIITQGKPKEEEKSLLSVLCESQSRNNENVIEILKKQKNNNLEFKKEREDKIKWRSYATTFKYFLNNNFCLSERATNKLSNIFKARGVKNIAIYGNFETTKVIVNILKDSEINIKYIVEHAADPVITTISRNAEEFPMVDLMLIADVNRCDAIERKLKKMDVKFPYISIENFIKELAKNDI